MLLAVCLVVFASVDEWRVISPGLSPGFRDRLLWSPELVRMVGVGTAVPSCGIGSRVNLTQRVGHALFRLDLGILPSLITNAISCLPSARVITSIARARLADSCSVSQKLSMHRGGDLKGVVVRAKIGLAAGDLVIAPLVKNPGSIVEKTTSPYALPATVGKNDALVSMWTLGTSTLPPNPSSTTDVVFAKAQMVLPGPLDWKANHFPWPLWLVRRTENPNASNCKLVDFTSRVINTFACSNPREQGAPADSNAEVDALDTEFPVMVNSKAINSGDELVVFWPKGQAGGKDTSKEPKPRTWTQSYSATFAKRLRTE